MTGAMSYHTRTSLPATVRYILNQEEHHAKKTYDEEWKVFLDPHGLETDD